MKPRHRWPLSTSRRLKSFLGFVVLCATGCSPGVPPGGTGGKTTDDSGDDTDGAATGVLRMHVVDLQGSPVAGATVTLSDGRSIAADDSGYMSLSNLPVGERVIVTAQKAGFTSTTKAFATGEADTATVNRIYMGPAGETVSVNTDDEVTHRSRNSRVKIQAGSLVDSDGNPITGNVELTVVYFDPSTEERFAFPGSFDEAQAANGDAVSLESFGFAVYELSQAGEAVNLAPDTTAEIEYVLPTDSQDDFGIGDSIGLWEFYESTATWIQAGDGQIREASDGSGQLSWFAEVDHFSAWNCDEPDSDKHCITGRIELPDADADCGNAALAWASLIAMGVSYNGYSNGSIDPATGRFCVDVKRGSVVTLEFWDSILESPVEIPAFFTTLSVPDTEATCATGGCLDFGLVTFEVGCCIKGRVLFENGRPPVFGRVVAGGISYSGNSISNINPITGVNAILS